MALAQVVQLMRRLNPLTEERHFSRLLDSGYMSDCTVICWDTKWATHKVILCSRSKWFRAALDGSFQVKLIV